MSFTEKEILEELDLACKGIPSGNYPPKDKEDDIQYNFFLDLENAYCDIAGSKIHLYGDEKYWAVVFEIRGYFNRGYCSDIQLDFVGNCIKYNNQRHSGRVCTANSIRFPLITADEYESIRNVKGEGLENFELIAPYATDITIHGTRTSIEQDASKYLSLSITLRDHNNSDNLIGYADIIRYFSETNPSLVSATEQEIKQGLLYDIPKLVVIDKFHFESYYAEELLPSEQELYQLLAKILVTKDISRWQPTQPHNNHWSNWKSGFL